MTSSASSPPGVARRRAARGCGRESNHPQRRLYAVVYGGLAGGRRQYEGRRAAVSDPSFGRPCPADARAWRTWRQTWWLVVTGRTRRPALRALVVGTVFSLVNQAPALSSGWPCWRRWHAWQGTLRIPTSSPASGTSVLIVAPAHRSGSTRRRRARVTAAPKGFPVVVLRSGSSDLPQPRLTHRTVAFARADGLSMLPPRSVHWRDVRLQHSSLVAAPGGGSHGDDDGDRKRAHCPVAASDSGALTTC